MRSWRKRASPGWIFAHVCAGFIVGVALASFEIWNNAFYVIPTLGGIFTLLCLWFFRTSRRDAVLLALCFVFGGAFGVWRHGDVQPKAESVAFAGGEHRTVEGTVLRIDAREASTRITLGALIVDGIAREDRFLLRTSLFASPRVGDRVQVVCDVERPEAFDAFAYDRYLAAKDIVALCSSYDAPFVVGQDVRFSIQFLRAMDSAHGFVVRAIDRVFPDPHAQLLAGLLVGDDAFSEVWQQRFLRTGTSHVVAASGSNVALVVALALGACFLAGISRRMATGVVFAGIVAFVFLAGGESAVLRAGIMASLLVFARALGRATTLRNVLLLTVASMLWFEPRILRDDIGFQLSVLSTLGLLFFAKPLTQYLDFLPERFGMREGLATTLAATCATLPITLLSMGQFVPLGPFANMLILPLLPFAMASGAFATVVGMVAPFLGRIAAFPAWWILDVVLLVLRELTFVPGWVVGGGGGVLGVMIVVAFYRNRRGRSDVGCRDVASEKDVPGCYVLTSAHVLYALFAGMFAVSLCVHVARDGWFSSGVRVWVFDVGQGDALFIDTPRDDVLIDGGPSNVMGEKLGMVLPWMTRDLAYVFVTHPHADHLVGTLGALDRYAVGQVGKSGQACGSFECAVWDVAAPNAVPIQAGDVFTLADGVALRAVWPQDVYNDARLSDPNTGSLVFVLETPYGSMLLTGDAGVEEEAEFIADLPSKGVEVLKLGHHGSRTATSPALLDALHPAFGIISLGEGNSYGHPHEETLQKLFEQNISIFRTDVHGDIRILFTKEGVRVQGFWL